MLFDLNLGLLLTTGTVRRVIAVILLDDGVPVQADYTCDHAGCREQVTLQW